MLRDNLLRRRRKRSARGAEGSRASTGHALPRLYPFYRRRLAIELLEDRRVLASCPVLGADPYVVGGLQFCGDFQPDGSDGLGTTTDLTGVPVQVGLLPVSVEPFNPLLQLTGTIEIPTEASGLTVFQVGGLAQFQNTITVLNALPIPLSIWKLGGSGQVSFDANLLTGDMPGGLPLTAGGTSVGTTVAAVDSGFVTKNIQFFNPGGIDSDTSDAQVWLKGSISFDSVGFTALTVGVDGANHVAVDSTDGSITLTGINATVSSPNISFGGVMLQGSLGASYTPENHEFGFVGDAKIAATGMSGPNGGSMVDVSIGTPGLPGLIVRSGELTAFDLSLTGSFRVWDLLIQPMNLTFQYNTDASSAFPNSFVMYGGLTVKVPNGQASSDGEPTGIRGSFGTAQEPGFALNVQTGTVEHVNIGISGDVSIFGFQLSVPAGNPVRFSYDATEGYYGLSGTLTAPQLWNAEVIAGTNQSTGIQIEDGKWSVDDLSIGLSDIKLGAFKIRQFFVSFEQFQALQVTGDITKNTNTISNVTTSGNLNDLQVGQPVTGPGIPDDTVLASVDIDAGTLTLSKNATETASSATLQFDQGIDISTIAIVVFPGGWEVAGEIDMLFNQTTHVFELNEVFLKWQADSQAARIPVGATGLFLTSIDATVDNVLTSDVSVSGQITVEYGKQAKFLGAQANLFSATGSFTVDKDHLEIDASVLLGSYSSSTGQPRGVLGSATGTLYLDWNDAVYYLDVKGSMFDGVFTFEVRMEFDESQEVLLFAEADVNVPDGIPFIGGKRLGDLTFMMKYSYPDASDDGNAQGFVAAWAEVNLIFKKVPLGFQYDFVSKKAQLINEGTIQSDLSQKSQDTSKPYTYQQVFNVPALGATQASLTADWSRAFPAGAKLSNPNVTIVGENWQTVHESAFAPANGLALLPQFGMTKQVTLAGSASNDLMPLPVAPQGDYTLQLSVTSDQPPRSDRATVQRITSFENPDATQSARLTISPLPGDLRVGDVMTMSGSTVSAYNTQHTIVQILEDNTVVTDQPYTSDDVSGAATVKGWYVPQFHSTFHIPATVFAAANPITIDAAGNVHMNVSIAGLPSLQAQTTVDVYVDRYNSALQTQEFNGALVAKNLRLSGTPGGSLDPVTMTAAASIDLSQLDPAFEYYVYAVVNDGTNPAATSPASDMFQVQAAVEGQVLAVSPGQTQGTGLSGWTVFVDENANGILDVNELHTTTISSGNYSFVESQSETLQVLSIGQQSGSSNSLVTLSRPPVHGLRVGSILTMQSVPGYTGTFTVTDVLNSTQVVIGQPYSQNVSNVVATSNTPFPTGQVDLVVDLLGSDYQFDNPASGQAAITYSGTPFTADFLVNEKSAIKGKVTDVGNNPLAGRVVYLDENQNGVWDADEEFQVTDTSGNYKFPNPTPATYVVALANLTGATDWFRFDDADGMVVPDSSGSPSMHVGTLVNGAAVGTASSFGIGDRPGATTGAQVLRLNGANQFVNTVASNDLEPGTGSFSFAAWIRPESGTGNRAIAGAKVEGQPGWMFRVTGVNSQLQLQLVLEDVHQGQGKYLEIHSQTLLQPEEWYHVAFTYDGTNSNNAATIYVNGVASDIEVPYNALPDNPDITSQGNSFKVGAVGGAAPQIPFVGYLDEVAAWKTQLNQQQVQAHLLGTTLPGQTQITPSNPNHYTVTIDTSGTDVEAGNDFGIQQRAAVSGKVTLASARVDIVSSNANVGGASGDASSTAYGLEYSVTSNGTLGPTTDKFHYLYSPIAGDGTFTASVIDISVGIGKNATPNARGGVMFRAGLTDSSPFVAVWMQADNQVAFQWRDTAGQAVSTPVLTGGTTEPKWVRLERNGNDFTASYSTDGGVWTVMGAHTLDLPDPSLVGLFTASGSNSQSTARFTNIDYTALVPGREGTINLRQNGAVVASASLFPDGSYLVPGLEPGAYEIEQIPPGGYFQVSPSYNEISYANEQYSHPNSQQFNSVTVGDFDRDGISDLAFSSPGSPQLTVAYGVGDGTFTDPHTYSAGSNVTPVKITSADRWDAGLWVLDGVTGEVVWLANVNEGRDSQFSRFAGANLLPAGVVPIDIAAGRLMWSGPFPNGQNIGNPPIAGSGTFDPTYGSYTLQGSGRNNNRAGTDFGSDLFFQSVLATGDGVFTIHISDMNTSASENVIAGIMIRNGSAPDDNFVAASVQHSADNGDSLGVLGNWRSNGQTYVAETGTSEIDFPGWGLYLRLIKTGNMVEAWTQFLTDQGQGAPWQKIGEQAIDLNTTFEIGLFATSSSSVNASVQGPGPLTTANFDHYAHTFAFSGQSVVSYQDTSGGSATGFSALEISADGSSRVIYASPSLLFAGDVTLADINLDGHADIVLNGGNNKNELTLGFGDGKGNFTLYAVAMPTSFGNGGAITVGDVNGDKRPDLVAADQNSGAIVVALQDSGGGFPLSQMVIRNTGGDVVAKRLVIEDLNGDGKPELVALPVNGHVNQVNVFVNSLSTESLYPATPIVLDAFGGPSATTPALDLATGDWNKDHVPDFLVLGQGQSHSGVMLGDPLHPTTITIPVLVDSGQLVTGNDFADSGTAQVSGTVYQDRNVNLRIDGADARRGGAIVYVDLDQNGQLDPEDLRTVTDMYGTYGFEGLADGTYEVRLHPVPGFLFSADGGGYQHAIHTVTVGTLPSERNDFLIRRNARLEIVSVQHTNLDRSSRHIRSGEKLRLFADIVDQEPDTGYRVVVDWGDGKSKSVSTFDSGIGNGQIGIDLAYAYDEGGTYNVTVTIIDGRDASVYARARHVIMVAGAGIQSRTLNIVGTPGNDRLTIRRIDDRHIALAGSFLDPPITPQKLRRHVYDVSNIDRIEVTMFDGLNQVDIDPQLHFPINIFGNGFDDSDFDRDAEGATMPVRVLGAGHDTFNSIRNTAPWILPPQEDENNQEGTGHLVAVPRIGQGTFEEAGAEPQDDQWLATLHRPPWSFASDTEDGTLRRRSRHDSERVDSVEAFWERYATLPD